MIGSRLLRRLFAAALSTSVTTGCVSTPAPVRPDLHAPLTQITSMTAIAVHVTVSSTSFFGDSEARRDWSETAHTNLMQAITKNFRQDSRFVPKDAACLPGPR